MAAVPQNNLREQLRLHSARGALRQPAPPRAHRHAGFTFKKPGAAAAPHGEPRGPGSALRDKDVNTSLPALPSSLPASRHSKTQIQEFFPAVSGGRSLEPGPAGTPQTPHGPAASGKRSGTGGLPRTGPITIGDEWDDIDDFDLSGTEKKYGRAPALPSPEQPPRSHPGRAGAEPRPRACPPHSGESSSADVAGEEDTEGAHTAAAAQGGESQKPGSDQTKSPPGQDEPDFEPFPLIDLEEEDYLDVIPPSPEEELPSISPSLKSIR
ncbi:Bloom syndrome protein-like [Calypte anna]|uniref:Bloom syndrome protein-like n=1 Tax=Calypte anna TaxID=9244 RepID=UPI0011C3BA43|nr:Bloom syndrome protein-like [Calypte anna]